MQKLCTSAVPATHSSVGVSADVTESSRTDMPVITQEVTSIAKSSGLDRVMKTAFPMEAGSVLGESRPSTSTPMSVSKSAR